MGARFAFEKACSKKVGCWEFADFLSKGSPDDVARAHKIYADDCKRWHDGCATVVPELATPTLRCCDAARARLGPGDLMKAMILASCFDDARGPGASMRVRDLARQALKTELVPECESLGRLPGEKPPAYRFEGAPTK
jgi:hypothetical protein